MQAMIEHGGPHPASPLPEWSNIMRATRSAAVDEPAADDLLLAANCIDAPVSTRWTATAYLRQIETNVLIPFAG